MLSFEKMGFLWIRTPEGWVPFTTLRSLPKHRFLMLMAIRPKGKVKAKVTKDKWLATFLSKLFNSFIVFFPFKLSGFKRKKKLVCIYLCRTFGHLSLHHSPSKPAQPSCSLLIMHRIVFPSVLLTLTFTPGTLVADVPSLKALKRQKRRLSSSNPTVNKSFSPSPLWPLLQKSVFVILVS